MIKYTDTRGVTTTISELAVEVIKRVQIIKEDKKVGNNELALQSDLNKAQVSRFFNFKVNLSLNKFLALVDALGYRVELVPKHEKEKHN